MVLGPQQSIKPDKPFQTGNVQSDTNTSRERKVTNAWVEGLPGLHNYSSPFCQVIIQISLKSKTWNLWLKIILFLPGVKMTSLLAWQTFSNQTASKYEYLTSPFSHWPSPRMLAFEESSMSQKSASILKASRLKNSSDIILIDIGLVKVRLPSSVCFVFMFLFRLHLPQRVLLLFFRMTFNMLSQLWIYIKIIKVNG